MPDLYGYVREFLHGYDLYLLQGARLTVLVALASVAFGTVLGLIGAGMKLSKVRGLRAIADAYTTIIRGVPELVLLMILFYGGTMLLIALAELLFGAEEAIDIDPFAAGVFALGIVFGGYATEVFRGAILAVPRGQIEAAYAVGMSRWLVFRRILMPQVWRFALPGFGNIWLVLLKDTALISLVNLPELMFNAKQAGGTMREPFTFFIAAAFMYLVLTMISMVVLQAAERHARRGVRQA
ncbi:MAG: ABC transporter permease [Alphaproteobacteria bacterium]